VSEITIKWVSEITNSRVSELTISRVSEITISSLVWIASYLHQDLFSSLQCTSTFFNHLVFCVMFCRLLFVLQFTVFDYLPLVSSNSSYFLKLIVHVLIFCVNSYLGNQLSFNSIL
jgi:hypothetical protein